MPKNLTRIFSTPDGPLTVLLWQLLEENAAAVLARLPDDLGERALFIGGSVCKPDERAAYVRIFGERHKAIKNGPGVYDELLAGADRCIEVRKVQEPSIAAWLRPH